MWRCNRLNGIIFSSVLIQVFLILRFLNLVVNVHAY